MSMHYELVITGGSQTGAKATLQRNAKTIVGTDLGCDIVLGGSGDACQLELQYDASAGWSITLLEGDASYENTSCTVDEPVAVTLGQPIVVGSAAIVIRSSGRIENFLQDTPSGSVPGDEHNAKGVIGQAFWHEKLVGVPKSFLLFGVVGIVLATSGLATVTGSLSGQPVEETVQSIRSLLDGAGFSRLEYR